jgi:hypothetical protein
LGDETVEIDWLDLVVTPLVAAAVGFAVWYFQSRIDALRRAQDRLHDDRRKIYADVLDPIIRTFAGIRNPKETQKAMAHIQSFDWRRTAFEFSLIGSDNVVRAFNSMMQYLYQFDPQGGKQADLAELMRLWGSFLLEIRKNVGDPTTGLTPQDMLKPHIKDIETLFPK